MHDQVYAQCEWLLVERRGKRIVGQGDGACTAREFCHRCKTGQLHRWIGRGFDRTRVVLGLIALANAPGSR